MNVTELQDWSIRPWVTNTVCDPQKIHREIGQANSEEYFCSEPMQVHDILLEQGAIPSSILETGASEQAGWVAGADWIYWCTFSHNGGAGRQFLHCPALDTVCELYLNGEHIGTSRSMYLPFRRDITALLRAENELVIYFYAHKKVVGYYERTMPEEWRGNIPAESMLLRSHDYGMREDDHHGYSPIGIFGKVTLESVEQATLELPDLEVRLNSTLDCARVSVGLSGELYGDFPLTARLTVSEEDGSGSITTEALAECQEGLWSASLSLQVHHPKLWWPKNYGGQPMYRMKVELLAENRVVAEGVKPFGIREIRRVGDMHFECNHVSIRFWGGNFAPIWGPSNRFNEAYALDLVEKVDLAGMNAIRIWGPNKPYPDVLYDTFDRLGILVWQDFPTGGSQLPDSPAYRELLCEQARRMISRLKHHPSIYMWCGGNENIYMCELRGEIGTHGFDILRNSFRDVCAQLDPQRYYHASCPDGGHYTNFPLYGDSHGSRALRAYCAGEAYGVYYSENIRVYPPQYKSMRRWLGDEVWEEGYIDAKHFGCVKPVPGPWQKRLTTNGEEKFGPIWDYYAADNPRDLIYKFTAAAGQDLYQMYARSRRGNPPHKSHEPPFCQGFMVWKLNDPWPNFYCALIDYYGECSLPYYAVKRAVRPVWIDFEVADHIYLWGVNDTREAVSGTLELTLYNLEEEAVKCTLTLPVALHPGSSRILTDLDGFGFLHWFTLLHARLIDGDGNELLATNAYLTKENMLPFHDAKVSMERDGDTLILTTGKFARSVELGGGESMGGFGWFFEDNYFDLFPFEEKRVKILRQGEGNCICAKPQYSPHVAKVTL